MARGKRPPRPNALVAAARRVQLGDRKVAAGQGGKPQEWHAEAWAYFDEVPEIKESVRYRGNQVGKVRLFVAVDNPTDPDGDPVPVSDEASGVPTAVAAAAEAELGRLRSKVGGQAEIMRMLDMNLEVPGECYLVGLGATTEDVKQRDGTTKAIEVPEDWQIRSTSEVLNQDGVYKIKAGPSDSKPRVLDGERDTIMRIWTRHPQWSEQPDSAMRGLLGDLRALQVLQQQVLAHANRSLSAGFFCVPNELSFGPANPTEVNEDGSTDGGGDQLDDVLHAVLVAPIEDPSATASVQPGLLRGPAEYLKPDALRRITFYDADVVAGLEARIEARVARIARGLNLPVEKVMGHQQTTFANAAQVDEDEYNDYLAPSVDTATDALTWAFLQPQLAENPAVPSEWVDLLYVAADPSGLIATPDTEANANDGWDRGVLSDAAWRQAKGFGGDDAPSADELLIRSGLRRGILTADLTLELLNLLTAREGLPPIELPEPPAEGEGEQAPPDPEAVARMLHQLATDPGAVEQLAAALGLDHRSLGRGPAPPPFASRVVAAAPTPGDTDYGRQLTDLDRDLRARLLVATNEAMGRALEKAANRLRSKTNGTELRRRLGPEAHPFARLGPALVADVMGADDPLAGAWDELGELFAMWCADAQARALDVLAAAAGGLTDGARAGLAERQATDLADAWAWMAGALTDQAGLRLYSPDPAAPEQGEHDPTLRVPAGLVRQAIARAGGAEGLLTAAATAPGPAWVTLTDGGSRPAGGIGTGEVIRTGMREAGVTVEAYRWVYGPAYRQRPFKPHERLDGVVFSNFDDPQLANTQGWPPGAFYLPGDHSGCICDFEPVVVPAPAAQAATTPAPEAYPGDLSAREATKWMTERWGTDAAGARTIALDGVGPKAANAMAATMHDLLTRHPNTAARVRVFGGSADVTKAVKAANPRLRVGNISGRAFADAERTTGWIRLNATRAKKPAELQADLDRNVLNGFLQASGASTEAVVRHEFGHHFKWAAEAKVGAAEVRRVIDQVVNDYTAAHGDLSGGLSRARYDATRTGLSRYATTNHDELVAEAFGEYNSTATPRPLAKALVEALLPLAEGP